MRLAILGATGACGHILVEQALNTGHDVIALARNPQNLNIKHQRLQVEKVDIFSDDSLRPHFKGCDVIMSCLATKASWCSRSPITFYLDSMEVIIKAMRDTSVTRLVCMSAICAKADPNNPWYVEWLMRPLYIGQNLASLAAMEDYLFSQKDINFTIVRSPGLDDEKIIENTIRTEIGPFVPGGKGCIPRANVTQFMLSTLETDKWDREAVAISV